MVNGYKEILDCYPWAFNFLTGEDFVSLSRDNIKTAQEILRSPTIRQRLSRDNLITLYQEDKTKAILLEIVSYADLFQLINIDTLPLADATYVYEHIDIQTLFHHAEEDPEIYQHILSKPPLFKRVRELPQESIDDYLLLHCPPALLVAFGSLYPDIARKIIRSCVLPPFSLLTGEHLAELGRNHPEIAREILKSAVARKRLNRNDLLTLCEKDKTLLLEEIAHAELSDILLAEKLSQENATYVYHHIDPDTLFRLAEKHPHVYEDILCDFSLFKKICRKPTLARAMLYNPDLLQQLSPTHLAILTLLDPITAEQACRKLSAAPMIDHFVSIGKNDPDTIGEILADPAIRGQLNKEHLFTLYRSLNPAFRGEALLVILSYPDLFKLIDLNELPRKDTEYVYNKIDPETLWMQTKEDPEIGQCILDDRALFEKLCQHPEIKSEMINSPDFYQSLSKEHVERLNPTWSQRLTSWFSSWLPGTKAPSDEHAIRRPPSFLTAYPQQGTKRASNTLHHDEEAPGKKRKTSNR